MDDEGGEDMYGSIQNVIEDGTDEVYTGTFPLIYFFSFVEVHLNVATYFIFADFFLPFLSVSFCRSILSAARFQFSNAKGSFFDF